jgi:hypothetical protein
MKKKKKSDSAHLTTVTLFSAKREKEEDKDEKIVLNMTFEEAMKKALNTPLPTKKKT